MSVEGSWSPAFTRVVTAFATAVTEVMPGGGALAVYVGGQVVVDVWAGIARPRESAPWQADTLAVTFSCTKGLLASCLLLAAQDGDLDLDEPVAEYWPTLAAGHQITPRLVLAHRAGLAALDVDLTREEALDGLAAVTALERQQPLWEPGTGHAYHAMTYGWLVAEILRRATGRPLADHLDRLFDHPVTRGIPGSACHPAPTTGLRRPPGTRLRPTCASQRTTRLPIGGCARSHGRSLSAEHSAPSC